MNHKKFRVTILLHINYLIILGSAPSGLTWEKKKLGFLFKMNDLGELRYHLGVYFERNRNIILLQQTAHFKLILEQIWMDSAKPATMPTVETIDDLLLESSDDETGHVCCERVP